MRNETYFRRQLSFSTAFVLPALFAFAPNALAQCVASAGTVAVPANGATVTCYAGQTSTTQIGDGTTSATVNLQDNHFLNQATAGADGIYLQTATVTLGTGARINNVRNAIATTGVGNVTLGSGAQVNATSIGIESYASNSTVILGDNAQVNSGSIGILQSSNAVITLSAGAEINAGTIGIDNIFTASKKVTVTLGSNAQIIAGSTGVNAKYTDISMQSGAKISGSTRAGVYLLPGGGGGVTNVITLASGAEISSASNIAAIYVGDGDLTLTNAGLISDPAATALDVYGKNNAIVNSGTITGTTGIIIGGGGAATGSIDNQSGGLIRGTTGAGIQVSSSAHLNGGITNAAGATISGVTGIKVESSSSVPGGITTSGTITGTGGTAISLNALPGATPVNINGGAINGDVTDSNPSAGYSPVTIGGNFSTSGNFTVSSLAINSGDTLTISPGNTVTLDTMAAAPAGTLQFSVNNAASHGMLNVTSSGINVDTSRACVQVGTNSVGLAAGSFLIGTGNAADPVNGAGLAATTVADSSYLWNFQLEDGSHAGGTNNQLYLVASQNGTITAAATPSTAGVAAVLQGLTGSGNSTIQAMIGALYAAPNQTALNNLLELFEPILNEGAMKSALNVGDSTWRQFNSRMSALEADDGVMPAGMAAGDITHGVHMWMQSFGDWANQSERAGFFGYRADTYGMTAGVDNENLIDNGTLGVAVSYGRTNVNAKTGSTASTDVDSYQLSLYGNRQLGAKGFLRGMLGYGFNTNKTDREPVANTFAKGSYNADQFTAKGTYGYNYRYRGMLLTPDISLMWAHYSAAGYKESGAGAADLTVGSSAVDLVQGGIGLQTGWKFSRSNGDVLKPEVHVKYFYDFSGEALTMTAQLAANGASWTATGPEPARSTYDIGGTVHMFRSNNWNFSAGYDFRYKSNYTENAFMIRAEYRF